MTEPAKDEAELLERIAGAIPMWPALAGIRAAGWAVVPVEPTKEMLRAGYDESGGRAVISIWEAMIAAAPGVKP